MCNKVDINFSSESFDRKLRRLCNIYTCNNNRLLHDLLSYFVVI